MDNAKKSNFINYLQTKHNEINHQKIDHYHPRMYYLTNNAPTVRTYQAVEKPVIKADFNTMKKSSSKAKISLSKDHKHSSSVPSHKFKSGTVGLKEIAASSEKTSQVD